MSHLCNSMLMSNGTPPSLWATWNGSLDGVNQTFQTLGVDYCKVVALSSTLVVVTYPDDFSTGAIFVVAGTVSGTTITWGTPTKISVAVTTGQVPQITAMSATTAVVAWVDADTITTGVACAISVSGTTITSGTPVVVFTDASGALGITITSLTSIKAVAAYYGVTTRFGNAKTVDLSTLVISLGSAFAFTAHTISALSIAPISSTQVLVGYNNSAASNVGLAQVLNISGDTITGNTAYQFTASNTDAYQLSALSSSKFGIIYRNSSVSSHTFISVLSLAGTVVSFGTGVEITTISAFSNLFGFCKADSQTLFSIWNVTTSNTKASTISILGTTATVNSAVTYSSSNLSNFGCANINNTSLVTCFENSSNANKGTSRISSVV